MTDRPNSTPRVFSLIRLKPHCKIPPTLADFTPPTLPINSKQPTLSQTSSITPVFNHDLKHYTPAFTLPTDQVTLQTFRSTIKKTTYLSETYSKRRFVRSQPHIFPRRFPITSILLTSLSPTPTTVNSAKTNLKTTMCIRTHMPTDSEWPAAKVPSRWHSSVKSFKSRTRTGLETTDIKALEKSDGESRNSWKRGVTKLKLPLMTPARPKSSLRCCHLANLERHSLEICPDNKMN